MCMIDLQIGPYWILQDIIGCALEKIGSYSELDNQKQVVALINEVYKTTLLKRLFF